MNNTRRVVHRVSTDGSMYMVARRRSFMNQLHVARLEPHLCRHRLIAEGAGVGRPVDERFDKFLVNGSIHCEVYPRDYEVTQSDNS